MQLNVAKVFFCLNVTCFRNNRKMPASDFPWATPPSFVLINRSICPVTSCFFTISDKLKAKTPASSTTVITVSSSKFSSQSTSITTSPSAVVMTGASRPPVNLSSPCSKKYDLVRWTFPFSILISSLISNKYIC